MQQTGEILRNPSTSENSTLNGAVEQVHFSIEVSFNHPSMLRNHTIGLCFCKTIKIVSWLGLQLAKLFRPGDMQWSTQDMSGFHWKKWIRENVGRLRPGSPLACGMKNSVKHLARKKKLQRSSLSNPNPETTTHVLHSGFYCTLLQCSPTFHVFNCRPSKAQNKFQISVVSSTELRLGDTHGMSWQAFFKLGHTWNSA